MKEKFDPGREKPKIIPLSPKQEELRSIKLAAKLSMQPHVRINAQKELFDFAEDLRNKYPDYNRYKPYHVLAGSSPDPSYGEDYFTDDDFPEDDSVEKFIRRWAERWG